jgi:molecular chaperone DnaK
MASEFKKEHGIDISNDKMVAQRLKEQAEKSKKELSSAMNTEINLPFLTADATGPKHLMLSLSRSKFEQMINGIIERTLEPCRRALKDAGVNPSEVDEVILVGGSTRIPLVQSKVKELFGREPNRSVNPDEVVAMGAAIQGGILSGDVKDVLLLDVTPLSLGIETMGGIVHKLIPRNTTIPAKKSETFSTAQDNQQAVDIQVFQGERHMARDNKRLGEFRLEGIDPAPRGQPQVEVTFDIDANGILKVSAKDKKNGKEKNITIQGSSGLSKEEIDRAVKEAEANEAADQEKRELVESTNKLDSEIYQIENMLNENREKLPEQMIAEFDNMLIDAKAAKDSGDKAQIDEASGKLSSLMQQLSQAAQGQAAQEPGAAAEEQAAPADDDVIDVEFED